MMAWGRGSVPIAFALMSASLAAPTLAGALAVQLQADLQFDDTRLGLLISLFWALTGLTAPIGGRLADRLGWQRAGALGSALMALALGGGAVFATSWLSLMAWMWVAAVAYGLCSPTSNLVVAQETPATHWGRAFGLKQTAPPVVGMVAGAAVPVIAVPYGWRWVMALFILPSLVTLVLTLRARRRTSQRTPAAHLAASGSGPATTARTSPSTHPAPALTPRPTPAAGSARPPATTEVRHPRRGAGATTTETQDRPGGSHGAADGPARSLRLIMLAAALGTFSVGSLMGFSIRSLVESGLSPEAAGATVSVAGLGALAMRLGTGWWVDRWTGGRLWPAIWMLAVSLVCLLMVASGIASLVVPGMLLATAFTYGWPPLLVLYIVQHSRNSPGKATGTMLMGTGAGLAVAPVAFAAVATAAGYGRAWLVVAALGAVAGVLMVTEQLRARR